MVAHTTLLLLSSILTTTTSALARFPVYQPWQPPLFACDLTTPTACPEGHIPVFDTTRWAALQGYSCDCQPEPQECDPACPDGNHGCPRGTTTCQQAPDRAKLCRPRDESKIPAGAPDWVRRLDLCPPALPPPLYHHACLPDVGESSPSYKSNGLM